MGLGNGFGSMMLSRGRKSKSVVSGASLRRKSAGVRAVRYLWPRWYCRAVCACSVGCVFCGCVAPSPPSALPRFMRARGGIVVSWRFGSREAAKPRSREGSVGGGRFSSTSTSTVRQGGLSTSTRGDFGGAFFVLVLVLVLEFDWHGQEFPCRWKRGFFRSACFPARKLCCTALQVLPA
jgi:hypothetical protein